MENQKKNILFVSAECRPFCCNGGVADMCYALPKYLNRDENFDVRVILPLYSKIPEEYKSKFELLGERTIELSWRKEYCGVYLYELNGITFYFIDNKGYFDRQNMFGYEDDIERFSFFSKAVLDVLPMINFFPDIIHTNDWQSSIVCSFLKVLAWQNPKYEHIKTVMNLHNLTFQGIADFNIVKDLLGIEDKFAYLYDFFGKANLTKAGIMCTDKMVAVSNAYKDEILNSDNGNGLQGILQSFEYKLDAITNGIDYEFYNPLTDPTIFKTFDENSLENRVENKLKLQEMVGLPVSEITPLFAFIGYFSEQKGFSLYSQCLETIIKEKNIQFVALGGGNSDYENFLKDLEYRYPQNVKVIIKYDSQLAKKIYAGSDFMLNTSSVEPCGLRPLIANRYGSLPIVFYTGGLKENFEDFKTEGGNAYVLKNFDASSFFDIVSRAIYDFENKEKMKSYIISGMKKNFSIVDCANSYIKLYNKI